MPPIKSSEISRWYPCSWNEITGNAQVVKTLKNYVKNDAPCNTIITGPTGTGKTRVISLLIRTLLCPQRTATNDPCGTCDSCLHIDDARYSQTGLFRNVFDCRYEFMAIDCENLSLADFANLSNDIQLDSEKTLIYLDEVSAITQKNGQLERKMLKTIGESKAIWFASAISLKQQGVIHSHHSSAPGMAAEMQRRFSVKLGTSLPDEKSLTQWIKRRCDEWSIKVEHPEITIPMMVKKSQQRVGLVINLLAFAASQERVVNPEIVKEFPIEVID